MHIFCAMLLSSLLRLCFSMKYVVWNKLIDWLIDRLIDWLVDWLIAVYVVGGDSVVSSSRRAVWCQALLYIHWHVVCWLHICRSLSSIYVVLDAYATVLSKFPRCCLRDLLRHSLTDDENGKRSSHTRTANIGCDTGAEFCFVSAACWQIFTQSLKISSNNVSPQLICWLTWLL